MHGTRRRRLLAGAALALMAAAGTASPAAALPDNRAWEMVSPVDKNGGRIADPDQAGSLFAVAASGGAIAYASPASFGGAAGAPPLSQYIATRSAVGWATENISPAALSGAYEGPAYLAFSRDLSRALLANPARCPQGDPCPPGYRLVELATGAASASPLDPGDFEGASPELTHLVFRQGEDLYRWSPLAGGLTSVNDAPAQALAAGPGAVSADGSRIYWQGLDGNLHLRQGAATQQVDAGQGGGGSFVAASADGALAYFTKSGHLYRYSTATDSAADLTPAGGLSAVLGTSADGAVVYFRLGGALRHWRNGITTPIAIGADLSDAVPDTSGASEDGARLFLTTAHKLTVLDTNNDLDVYQWEAWGTGSCSNGSGCLELISSGRSEGGATFADTSADGADAFFVTDRSLVPADPGSFDLYDARVGGGFPLPPEPIPCTGDSCQSLPPEPADPALSTLATGLGNPAVRYAKLRRSCAPEAREARRASRGARRLRRRARRAAGAAATKLERRAAKRRRAARRALRAARRCRAANRSIGR